MADSKIYNVGIIGWGFSAKVFHIPYITMTKGLNLVGGVTSKPEQIKAPLKAFATAGDLFSDSEIDLVVVATPPHTHFALVSAALEASKHVLCEKPFVPTSKEADQLAILAREKNRVLCVYQNRRWDSDFLTVRKAIEEGTLGRVYELETHYDRYRPVPSTSAWKNDLSWDQGGGPLYDLGTHLIDQAVHLFGKPDEVWGRFLCQREAGDGEADSITAVLSYQKRLDVIVRIGAVSCEKQQLRFWVRGTKGSLKKWGLDPQEDQLKAGKGERKEDVWQKDDFGVENKENVGRVCVANKDGKMEDRVYPTVKPVTYKGFYDQLVKSMESGKEQDIPVTASEAALVLRIIEAIRRSAIDGTKGTI